MKLNKLTSSITETVRSWMGFSSYGPYAFEVFGNGESIPWVGSTSALSFTPVYRATTLIANDIARTPAEFSNHSLERIWESPNRYQSGFDFRRQLMMNVLLFGNAFALINRRNNGEVYELVCLHSNSIQMVVDGPTPYYKHSTYGKIALEDMLHLRANNIDGMWGQSPINLCRTALVIALNQENNVKKNAENGGLPNLAFVSQGPMNQAARQGMLNEFMKNHTGTNAGKPFIASENMRIEKLTSTSVASDMDLARRWSVSDVSRMFGVPTSYLADTQGSVYGSMEFMSRMYLDSCLSHWFAMLSSEWEMKMGEEPLFDTDRITRPTMTETFNALRTGVESGVISRNEARAYIDYPPEDGLDGFILAKNMGTGGGLSNAGTDTSGGVSAGDI